MSARVELCYACLGRAMRAARRRRGLTQEQLAFYLGLTRASVANIENGTQRVMLHDLPHIAEVCRVRIRALLPKGWAV